MHLALYSFYFDNCALACQDPIYYFIKSKIRCFLMNVQHCLSKRFFVSNMCTLTLQGYIGLWIPSSAPVNIVGSKYILVFPWLDISFQGCDLVTEAMDWSVSLGLLDISSQYKSLFCR